MTSITAIPIADIRLFLSDSGVSVPVDQTQAYMAAWDLIQQSRATSAPISIIDWIIAYNLATIGIQVKRLKLLIFSLLPIRI